MSRDFSICMLCYNDVATVERSLAGMLRLAERINGEVVVVDNESTDGSWEVIESLKAAGVIAIRKKCSRGMGRETAFEASTAPLVIAQVDCDDEFSVEGMIALLDAYRRDFEGTMLMTRQTKRDEAQSITIAPRKLISRIGGWRDINWGEDWDLWNRAAHSGAYSFIAYPLGNPPHLSVTVRNERETEVRTKLATRFQKSRDAIRIGRPVFSNGERPSWGQRLTYWAALASVWLHNSKLDPVPMPWFDDTSPLPGKRNH